MEEILSGRVDSLEVYASGTLRGRVKSQNVDKIEYGRVDYLKVSAGGTLRERV